MATGSEMDGPSLRAGRRLAPPWDAHTRKACAAQYAYQFFGHAEEPMSPEARWLSGPSPDGKGEFSFADPAPRLGQEPELTRGPSSAHGGVEATRTNGGGGGGDGGITEKVKATVADKLS